MKQRLFLILCLSMIAIPFSACGSKTADIPQPDLGLKGSSAGKSEQPDGASPESEKTNSPAPGSSNTPGDSNTPTPGSPSNLPAPWYDEALFAEEITAAGEEWQLQSGTSMEDAIAVPLETDIYAAAGNRAPGWFVFTTGENKDVSYVVTIVNKSIGSGGLYMECCDESGKRLYGRDVKGNGLMESVYIRNDLAPNTPFYISVGCKYDNETIFYKLAVREDEGHGKVCDGEALTANPVEAIGAGSSLSGVPNAATNMDGAQTLPFGAEASGTVDGVSYCWYAFTTGESEQAQYTFTCSRGTRSSTFLRMEIFDKLGHSRGERLVVHSDETSKSATVTATGGSDGFLPNTTYYIRMSYKEASPMDYTLRIDVTPNTGDGSTPLLLAIPYELNATQLMFAKGTATLLDEDAVKTLLEPFSWFLLDHPDRAILLAGTTATAGEQAACEKLSELRAKAVKKILVQDFGVPESQVKTIGLGYEKDPFTRGRDRDSMGNFVESESVKNRRVILMDTEAPAAKKLMP